MSSASVEEGLLDCVYWLQSGAVTYLTVYNRDSTAPVAPAFYRFSCLVNIYAITYHMFHICKLFIIFIFVNSNCLWHEFDDKSIVFSLCFLHLKDNEYLKFVWVFIFFCSRFS